MAQSDFCNICHEKVNESYKIVYADAIKKGDYVFANTMQNKFIENLEGQCNRYKLKIDFLENKSAEQQQDLKNAEDSNKRQHDLIQSQNDIITDLQRKCLSLVARNATQDDVINQQTETNSIQSETVTRQAKLIQGQKRLIGDLQGDVDNIAKKLKKKDDL